MKNSMDWVDVALVLALVLLVASVVFVLVRAETDERICQQAGYIEAVRFLGEKHCLGIRDGQPVIVPLKELEGK